MKYILKYFLLFVLVSCFSNETELEARNWEKKPLINKRNTFYKPIAQTHSKIKKNTRGKPSNCEMLVDSLLNQCDLCEKSYVKFLNIKSTYCETELYNMLLDKSIERYRKTFNALEYEKLECIVKYTDGALSEYAGLVLKNLFLEYPKKLSDNIVQYEIDNDTSFVKSVIIMEATYFSENVALNKSINRFLYRNIE